MTNWKAINSVRSTPESSLQDNIDQAFKAEWCHLNIFGEDGTAIVWYFLNFDLCCDGAVASLPPFWGSTVAQYSN